MFEHHILNNKLYAAFMFDQFTEGVYKLWLRRNMLPSGGKLRPGLTMSISHAGKRINETLNVELHNSPI